MNKKQVSIEIITFAYALAYLPFVLITRFISTSSAQYFGRNITGLEMLPAMLILAATMTYIFLWLSGWAKDVKTIKLGSFKLPFADKWTFLSGICTAIILVSVPLSYTFKDVSIPFMQLLMRGDILIIAPIVDLISKRKVRWWSWAALVLTGLGLIVALSDRGGLKIPPLALFIIIIYTLGYFGRLFIMSKVSKNDDKNYMKTFFTEEKIIGFPIAIITLFIISVFSNSAQSRELYWGFTQIWHNNAIWLIALSGILNCMAGVFAGLILLDSRENSFCVPLERSASIIAGIIGTVILALFFSGKMPNGSEFIGAFLLIIAIIVLSIGPRVSKKSKMVISDEQ